MHCLFLKKRNKDTGTKKNFKKKIVLAGGGLPEAGSPGVGQQGGREGAQEVAQAV
jgi:hypothetical protein